MIQIDKNIPIPIKGYPYDIIDVGESFLIQKNESESIDAFKKRVTRYIWGKNQKLKPKAFSQRFMRDIQQIRIWRIK